ncbi:MAG TPA: DUF6531 domain-containing protein, partial [Rhizomicrobium sp.]|nr:DUF6531 domain-containing protein [Rhizomicrobium sp.]
MDKDTEISNMYIQFGKQSSDKKNRVSLSICSSVTFRGTIRGRGEKHHRIIFFLLAAMFAFLINSFRTAQADWYPSYAGSSNYGADYVGASIDALNHDYPGETPAYSKLTLDIHGYPQNYWACGPYVEGDSLCASAGIHCPSETIPTMTGCPTMDRQCDICGNEGDPVNVLSGDVVEEATDFTTQGADRLSLTRYYNSSASYVFACAAPYNSAQGPYYSRFGYNWRSQYDRYIVGFQSGSGCVPLSGSITQVNVIRADGTPVHFTNSGGSWYAAYCSICGSTGPAWSSSSDPRHNV